MQNINGNDNSVTIHQQNIQTLITNLNPTFMKEIFCLKERNYSTRKQNLVYPNPHTYGLEFFGYQAWKLWVKIPYKIQQSDSLSTFKDAIRKHCENICNCKLCKSYIANLGYINNSTIIRSP